MEMWSACVDRSAARTNEGRHRLCRRDKNDSAHVDMLLAAQPATYYMTLRLPTRLPCMDA